MRLYTAGVAMSMSSWATCTSHGFDLNRDQLPHAFCFHIRARATRDTPGRMNYHGMTDGIAFGIQRSLHSQRPNVLAMRQRRPSGLLAREAKFEFAVPLVFDRSRH